MNKAVCKSCGWEYKDTPGMGIHRTPIRCPECDGKILIVPVKK